MKRSLRGTEQQDEGGTSCGTPEFCKRKRKESSDESDWEEEGLDWGRLPQEILLNIFQYLPLLDRAYASQVGLHHVLSRVERDISQVLFGCLVFKSSFLQNR